MPGSTVTMVTVNGFIFNVPTHYAGTKGQFNTATLFEGQKEKKQQQWDFSKFFRHKMQITTSYFLIKCR